MRLNLKKGSFQDAPRTLDIDIIFFDNKKIIQKSYYPSQNRANRESVIIPLKYMKNNFKGKNEQK